MKTTTGVLIGAILVVAVILGVLWYQKAERGDDSNRGGITIGVTDATTDINNVSGIDMTIKKVELHSAANGWKTISSANKKYDLLALHASGKTELYAQDTIEAGTYDRVRITTGEVVVKTKNNGDVNAYTPGSQIVFNMKVGVKGNEDTAVKIDVLADKSLHTTKDGKFVFAAVVNAQSMNGGQVAVADDNSVSMTAGTVGSNATVGLDLDGQSRSNFQFDASSDIGITVPSSGGVQFMLGGKTFTNDGKDRDSADGLSLDLTSNSALTGENTSLRSDDDRDDHDANDDRGGMKDNEGSTANGGTTTGGLGGVLNLGGGTR